MQSSGLVGGGMPPPYGIKMTTQTRVVILIFRYAPKAN